jgi:hypothetical protein
MNYKHIPGKASHPNRYTQGNPDLGIQPKPILPTEDQVAVLRRCHSGFIIATMIDGNPNYSYDDGSQISLSKKQIQKMIKEGWLVPDPTDSLFLNGPAQVFRARKP